jgi:myosin heavy subunit
MYSIWLMPSDRELMRYQNIISEFSEHFNTPVFEPHITLFSGIENLTDEIIYQVSVLAALTDIFDVTFDDFGLKSNYYKSIYLKPDSNQTLEKMNQELDSLNSRKAMLEDEVAISALKREALTLYDNLRDLEQKRDELVDEENNRGTPAQERERLLSQVKEDNAEIATMEQQITEINEQSARLQDENTQLDQDMDENQSERNIKYRDLRKREETMDQVYMGLT